MTRGRGGGDCPLCGSTEDWSSHHEAHGPTPCSSQLTLRGCGQGWGVGQGLQAATVGGGGLRVGGWLDGWWVDESLVSACSSDPP